MACKYSLIIPVYQVKEYIAACLESIFCQIPTDVQVILVDDGSTDGSGEICDEYAKKYPQIEVIHQENSGVAAARNAGLRAAKGEYLLWVDPDDWVAEDWFASINAAITKDSPDFFVFDYIEHEDGRELKRDYARAAGPLDRELFLSDVTRDIRMNSSLWNKVIRRTLFDGLWFDEKLRCLEDYALLHWLIMRADSLVYAPVYLYYYRIRQTGLVRTPNLEISYQSYQAALQRKADIESTGRRCDVIGCVLQARGFCRNYYLCAMPDAQKAWFQECRRMILSHTGAVLAEKELRWTHRLKLILIACPALGKAHFGKRTAS